MSDDASTEGQLVDAANLDWTGETLAYGFRVPVQVVIRFGDWHGYRVEVHAELQRGRYRCTQLHVWQRDDGPEVTGSALRSIPVASMLKGAILAMDKPEIPEITKELERRAPTQETLRSVAQVYATAYLVGDPPKKFVAEMFKISTATASRWIARARETKLLTIDGPDTPVRSLFRAGG